MGVIEKQLVINNSKGLHVRAATLLAQTAAQYSSTVTVEHAGESANGKSIMNLLLLTASKGARVHVIADGDDASDAMSAISSLIEGGFGE